MVLQAGDGIPGGLGEARADERGLAQEKGLTKSGSGGSSGSINVIDVDPDYPTDEDFATLRKVRLALAVVLWAAC